MNAKTNQEFWVDWWKGSVRLPARIRHWTVINRRLDRLFRRYMPGGPGKLLEIGCSPASRLIYFQERLGYSIYGVEYTEVGFHISSENLRRQEKDATILHEDIFCTSFEPDSFDVVFSNGLVEHFEDPDEILEAHIRLAKPGGLVFILVPSRVGLVRFLQSLADRSQKNPERRILPTYRHISPEEFSLRFSRLGLKKVHTGYFGGINLMVVHWQSLMRIWVFRLAVHALNQVLGLLVPFNSTLLAPYVLAVGTKPETPLFEEGGITEVLPLSKTGS